MKRVTLTLSAAALCAAMGNSHAESDLSIYGKANITLNNIEEESKSPAVDEWQLNSNASRLGVKGSHDINDNFQAIYKMEFEVHIDDGQSGSSKDKDTFEQRNIYAGFRGDLGTLIAGKHDTPLKLAQGKVDRFNDQVLGDIKNYMEGEDRANNIVIFTSPSIGGFFASAALIPGEDSTGTTENDDLADGTSASLNYKNDWLTAAIARNDDVDSQDTTRVVVDIGVGNTQVGMLWQEAEKVDGTANEDSWLLSASQKLGGDWTLKAQYGQTDYRNNDEDKQRVFGVDKKLDKNTKLFAYYAKLERADATNSVDDTSFAVGYEIKF
ncbi:MAG: porin [Pseudomonadales bacterium]|nr:porin [Pseudomonadales bacterium]